ncbi:MAG: 16S rRNA methyltransferase [Chloroflexia bacterium]
MGMRIGGNEAVERLVQAVRARPRYRHIAADFIRHIAAGELAKRPAWKEALKATCRKLHQVAGAYLAEKLPYGRWLEELRAMPPEALRTVCARLMAGHSSTRERLPFLDRFYATCLAGLEPPRTVLDLGCGLHPLAIPWMPLAAGALYLAWDVYEDLVDFLNGFFALLPCRGRAEARDIGQSPPAERADLALLLKTLPVLEQVEKGAGRRLLESLRADVLLVSFPLQSLGGRKGKGMEVNYPAQFEAMMAGLGWPVREFVFPSEIVFRVEKG